MFIWVISRMYGGPSLDVCAEALHTSDNSVNEEREHIVGNIGYTRIDMSDTE